jgi:hypothetical protein
MEFGDCTETRHHHVRRMKGKPPLPIKCLRNANGHVYGSKPHFVIGDKMTPYYLCIMCGESSVVWFPCIRDGKRQ